MGLSNEEVYFATVIAAKVSGSLSMLGSGLIIRDVMTRLRRRRQQQYLPIKQRIILGMSIADLFSSFVVHFLGTWMVPKGNVTILGETFPIPLAAGNEVTCNIQAFAWDLFILAGCSSNATLALSYWLLVCKEKKENELRQRKWQFPLVWLPWLFALVDSFTFVVGFGFGGVNESWFCGAFVSVNSPHRAWRNGMLVAVAGTVNILIISTMGVLIKFVYTLEKKTDAYRRNGETRQKTIQVTKQGIWFILAYMAALIPGTLSIIFYDLPRPFAIFVSCTNPMQGAFNSLVYFRPKYIAERQKMVSNSHRRESRLSSLLNTLNVTLPRRSSVSGPKTPNHDDGGAENGCREEIIIEPPVERDEFQENNRSHLKCKEKSTLVNFSTRQNIE